MKHPGWRKAMEEEIAAPERNDTWSLEDLPSGKKAISSGCIVIPRIFRTYFITY